MQFIFNEKSNQWEVENYNQVIVDFQKFIDSESKHDLVITNDGDKKLVKSARTTIRKKKEEIATLRKNINLAILGTFNEQCKELEQKLDECDKKMKSNLEDYENKLGKPKLITLTIKSYDEKAIKKVKELAIKLNMEVKNG